jgi:hypothetical protein
MIHIMVYHFCLSLEYVPRRNCTRCGVTRQVELMFRLWTGLGYITLGATTNAHH